MKKFVIAVHGGFDTFDVDIIEANSWQDVVKKHPRLAGFADDDKTLEREYCNYYLEAVKGTYEEFISACHDTDMDVRIVEIAHGNYMPTGCNCKAMSDLAEKHWECPFHGIRYSPSFLFWTLDSIEDTGQPLSYVALGELMRRGWVIQDGLGRFSLSTYGMNNYKNISKQPEVSNLAKFQEKYPLGL